MALIYVCLGVYVWGWGQELVFRACMVPLLLAGGWSVSRVLWCSPLFFGLAHAHHTIQRVREGVPVGPHTAHSQSEHGPRVVSINYSHCPPLSARASALLMYSVVCMMCIYMYV